MVKNLVTHLIGLTLAWLTGDVFQNTTCTPGLRTNVIIITIIVFIMKNMFLFVDLQILQYVEKFHRSKCYILLSNNHEFY